MILFGELRLNHVDLLPAVRDVPFQAHTANDLFLVALLNEVGASAQTLDQGVTAILATIPILFVTDPGHQLFHAFSLLKLLMSFRVTSNYSNSQSFCQWQKLFKFIDFVKIEVI